MQPPQAACMCSARCLSVLRPRRAPARTRRGVARLDNPTGCTRIPSTGTLAELKRHEDAMDALLCAWAGARYLAGRARAHGDDTAAVWV